MTWAKLGRSFNEMLDTLEESRRAQRQLVADASHELRTPVATIRTNLEVLARNPDLATSDRGPLLEDLVGESTELGNLIENLLETARESDGEEPIELVRLDAIVSSELERWRRRQPRTALRCSVLPVLVEGRPSRLRRALANLLDNAIKWSPPDSPVDVSLAGSTLTVPRPRSRVHAGRPPVRVRPLLPCAERKGGPRLRARTVDRAQGRRGTRSHGGCRERRGSGALVTLAFRPSPTHQTMVPTAFLDPPNQTVTVFSECLGPIMRSPPSRRRSVPSRQSVRPPRPLNGTQPTPAHIP